MCLDMRAVKVGLEIQKAAGDTVAVLQECEQTAQFAAY
jgi:hypothetical protein